MAVKMEYKGTTVDEAINAACAKLKVAREELDIEIISPGSAGIFGLCKKKAVIAVMQKEGVALAPLAEGGGQEEVVKPSTNSKSLTRGAKTKPADRQKGERERLYKESAAAPTPEVVDEIGGLLKQMLDLLGFASEVDFELNNNRITARVNGADNEAIIGREGENIDAMQYLLRKIISHKYPEKILFTLDVGDYRDSRKKDLETRALATAAKVKETGVSQTIPALNPSERRIVHVALQDDATIRSVSVGDGLFKKIRIYVPGKGRKSSSYRPRKNRDRNAT